MKRILSMILALIMVLSVCSCLTFTVSALEDNERYQIETTGFKSGVITFDILLTPNQTIYDGMVSVKYDTSVLEVVKDKTGPATTTDSDGNENEIVPGMHEHGVPINNKSCYTFAYVNNDENGFKIGSASKKMFTITFKLKSKNTTTSIEFVAGDCDSTNTIKAYSKVATYDAPEISSVQLKDGSVAINWKGVTDAQGYAVYKLNGTSFEKIGSVGGKTTNYTDSSVKDGTTYTYGVATVDGNGNASFYNTFDVTYVAPPKTTFEIVKTGINVSWSKVTDAENYIVYRATSTDDKWSDWSEVATVEATSLTWVDTKVEKNVTYKYAVSAVVDGNKTAYTCDSSIKYVPLVTNLATPEVTAKNTAKGISVSWNEIAGAESYIVYKSVYNTNTKKWANWAIIKEDITETNYVDGDVILGAQYKYTVRAVCGDVKSKYVGTDALKYNVKPSVKIANAAKGIKVSWSTAANATGYTVYRSQYDAKTGKWSGWKTMGTAAATKTSWVDKSVKAGVQYKYTVRAAYNKVLSSYKASGDLMFLNQPTVKFANAAKGMKVSWSKSTGASGYTVYRSQYDAETGKWTKWQNMGTAKASKSSWVDKSVVSGVTYKYTVRAVNGKSMSSYANPGGLIYLAQPTVKYANAAKGIKVSWSQSEGATGFTVYRSQYDAKTGKWSKWSNRGTANASKSSWVDKKVTSGVTYKYTVRAVNGKVMSSYTDTKGLLYLAQPTVSAKAVDNGIKVAWSQSAGATGFTVYRSEYNAETEKWSGWKKMGTAKASKSSWVDKSAEKGVQYKYTVRAVNGKVLSSYVAGAEAKR